MLKNRGFFAYLLIAFLNLLTFSIANQSPSSSFTLRPNLENLIYENLHFSLCGLWPVRNINIDGNMLREGGIP